MAKMKPEIVNVTFTDGKMIKLLDSELGTALLVGNRIKVNTFPGGNAIAAEFPWNLNFGKALISFAEERLVSMNVTIDCDTGYVKYEISSESADVTGIVNINNVKLSAMCREISDGVPSTDYIANARITNCSKFEDMAFELADLFEKFGK